MAIIFAVVSMAAMPVWFPRGAAGVDHLAFALISLPAWWALAFFYVLLEENMPRAAIVLIAATLVKAAIAHSSGGW
ncbi:hypothetical protein [Erythrobacter rubeus]|nr:hypothetical protein [Erythrobacter rubeus]